MATTLFFISSLLLILLINFFFSMFFSFSQSILKPREPKSAYSGFPLNNLIRAVQPLSLTFPLSRRTNCTAHSCTSNCGLWRHRHIRTVQLLLSTQSRCLCNSIWKRLQLKSKPSSFGDSKRHIKQVQPLSHFKSHSSSSRASIHLASISRNRGRYQCSGCEITISQCCQLPAYWFTNASFSWSEADMKNSARSSESVPTLFIRCFNFSDSFFNLSLRCSCFTCCSAVN